MFFWAGLNEYYNSFVGGRVAIKLGCLCRLRRGSFENYVRDTEGLMWPRRLQDFVIGGFDRHICVMRY